MAKIALLIGVSEYQPGLNPLPVAIKDIEAMQRVLQNPEIGGFDEVKVLQNPEPIAMQEAVQTLFSDRARDDLVLLFFSGHGIKDDRGKLYFATCLTHKSLKGELMKGTAVSARFIQEIMGDSRSKRQIVILDCCFSGAFAEDLLAKDDGTVDVKSQLGGSKDVEGRVVLTSSTSTQYSFEQKGSELSIYTRYLIEGIETGAADKGDGEIDVDELHEYARSKVQEAAPAMQPKIFPSGESYKIVLAKAPTGDPKLKYQREVERICKKHKGEISSIGREQLNAIREKLRLSFEETASIEARVLRPYQDYKQNLKRYEETLNTAIQGKKELDEDTANELKDYQQTLGLRSEDVESIEIRLLGKTIKPKPLEPKSLLDAIKWLVDSIKLAGTGARIYIIAGVGVTAILGLGVITTYAVSRYRLEQFCVKGQASLDKGDFEEAKNNFMQALSIDQNSAKAYLGLGNALFSNGNGDVDQAIDKLNMAIQIDPNLAEAYFSRGRIEETKRKQQDALDDYTKAIQYDQNHVKAYLRRGIIYQYYKGKSTEAIEDANKAIALKPEFVEAHEFKCEVLYQLQKYDEAIKACSKAIDTKGIDDKDQKYKSYAYFYRASAYLDRNDPSDQDSAYKDSEHFLQDRPDAPKAYILQGRAYLTQQKYLKALEVFTSGINRLKTQNLDSDGNNLLARLYVYRGATRLQMQPPDQGSAADDYWHAIQADKNFAPAYESMGDLLSSIGDGNYVYSGCSDKSTCKGINFYITARDLYADQNFQEAYQRVLAKIQRR